MEHQVLRELAGQAEQVVLQEHQVLEEQVEHLGQVEHLVQVEVQVTMVQIVEDGHGRVQLLLMQTLYRTTLSQILVL